MALFVLSLCPFDISVDVGAFVIGLESDLFLFSLRITEEGSKPETSVCPNLYSLSNLKGIPGCFFTRTSLPKSSNNLEPICNYANVKCSRLIILRIIPVTSTFTV